MPSRKRPKNPIVAAAKTAVSAQAPSSAMSDADRFAAALKATEAAKRKALADAAVAKAEAESHARESASRKRELDNAQRDLQRAIDRVKQARAAGRGKVEADEAWKAAKARVIELETGEAPVWKPAPVVVEPEVADEASSDVETESGDSTAGSDSAAGSD